MPTIRQFFAPAGNVCLQAISSQDGHHGADHMQSEKGEEHVQAEHSHTGAEHLQAQYSYAERDAELHCQECRRLAEELHESQQLLAESSSFQRFREQQAQTELSVME